MKTYRVFQQLAPTPVNIGKKGEINIEYHMNLREVGVVDAYSGAHAIEKARNQISCFTHFTFPNRTLAAFPVVEEVKSHWDWEMEMSRGVSLC